MKRFVEEIMITEDGWLAIKRGGVLKEQDCPFCTISGSSSRCGDWCPHFGGQAQVDDGQESELGEIMSLALCNGTILIALNDISDMRLKKE